jgi:hypothetical protein
MVAMRAPVAREVLAELDRLVVLVALEVRREPEERRTREV